MNGSESAWAETDSLVAFWASFGAGAVVMAATFVLTIILI